jgi:transcriptional regulator with XRE-family HTH domain
MKFRKWREDKGLSLTSCARALQISVPYLSQVETGKRTPSVKTLRRIEKLTASAVGAKDFSA